MTVIFAPINYYNIPSNNRELQLSVPGERGFYIITYQVITGNYSIICVNPGAAHIITYQVITGNYSLGETWEERGKIITYQVITGNYSTTYQ